MKPHVLKRPLDGDLSVIRGAESTSILPRHPALAEYPSDHARGLGARAACRRHTQKPRSWVSDKTRSNSHLWVKHELNLPARWWKKLSLWSD